MDETKHRLIAIRFPDGLPETEPLVIVQQSTFDQAREALKMVKDWLDGERYADQDLPEICEKVTQAVAAMEATHECG